MKELHKLGDQWIEKGSDGKMHMYKAEAPIDGCRGCYFLSTMMYSFCCEAQDQRGCLCGKTFIVKDLGILNEDGCLPEERTGEYPTIKKVVSIELLMWVWWVGIDRKANIAGAKLLIGVEALTKEQAIDAWNWRV